MASKIRKDHKGPKTLVADKIDSVRNLGLDNHIVFSFIHLSKDQGASFEQWNEEGKLIPALERLKEYSGKKISQTDSIFTIYGDFPPKTKFRHIIAGVAPFADRIAGAASLRDGGGTPPLTMACASAPSLFTPDS